MASIKERRRLFDGKESVQKLSRTTKTLIRILGVVIAMAFTYLKLRGVSLIPVSNDAGAFFILKSTMVLYYLAWIFGTTSDVSDQETVYLNAPRQGRIPWHTIALAIFLAFLFALLCAIISIKWFVVLLSVFWVIQHVLWIYVIRPITCPAYLDSKKAYEGTRTWDRLELLEITYEYIAGRWIKFRFIFGILALAYINVITFSDLGQIITKRLRFENSDFTVSLTVLGFVCISEAWIWAMRIRTKMANYLYGRLVLKYRLYRKQTS